MIGCSKENEPKNFKYTVNESEFKITVIHCVTSHFVNGVWDSFPDKIKYDTIYSKYNVDSIKIFKYKNDTTTGIYTETYINNVDTIWYTLRYYKYKYVTIKNY